MFNRPHLSQRLCKVYIEIPASQSLDPPVIRNKLVENDPPIPSTQEKPTIHLQQRCDHLPQGHSFLPYHHIARSGLDVEYAVSTSSAPSTPGQLVPRICLWSRRCIEFIWAGGGDALVGGYNFACTTTTFIKYARSGARLLNKIMDSTAFRSFLSPKIYLRHLSAAATKGIFAGPATRSTCRTPRSTWQSVSHLHSFLSTAIALAPI